MNHKKYSVIFCIIPLCVILSSCSVKEKDNSTIDVSFSNKTIQITENSSVTSAISEIEETASTANTSTAQIPVTSVNSEAYTISSVPGTMNSEDSHITPLSSESVQSSMPLTTTVTTGSEVSVISSNSVSPVQSELTEEISGFDKVGGKWCFKGKEGTAYILIYDNGGWIQFDEHDNETASGILETENGNDYSMFTSDKQQYSDFTLKDEDYFKTSDGKDYYREYRNSVD